MRITSQFIIYLYNVAIYLTQYVFCIQELKKIFELVDTSDFSPILRDIKYNLYKCYNFDSNVDIGDRIYNLIVSSIKDDKHWIRFKYVTLPNTINMIVFDVTNNDSSLRAEYKKASSTWYNRIKWKFSKHKYNEKINKKAELFFNGISNSIKKYMDLSNKVINKIGNNFKTKMHMYDINLCILHKSLCTVHDIVSLNKKTGGYLGDKVSTNLKKMIYKHIHTLLKTLYEYLAKNILYREYYYFVIKDCNEFKSLVFDNCAYKDSILLAGSKFSNLLKVLKFKPDEEEKFRHFKFYFKMKLIEIKKRQVSQLTSKYKYEPLFIYDWCELAKFYE